MRSCANAIISGLLAVSNRHGEAIARVVQKTLDFMTKNPNADFAQAREIAETEGTRVATSLNNRVTYLADIGTIGPLVGLFGTVFGIIRSFGALGSELGPARYVLLSKGISEALINTCGGLGIGITAMIFYAFFRGRAQRLDFGSWKRPSPIFWRSFRSSTAGAGNARRSCSKMNFERR